MLIPRKLVPTKEKNRPRRSHLCNNSTGEEKLPPQCCMDRGWGWNQGAEGPYMQPSLGGGTDTLGTNFLQKMRPRGGQNGVSEGRQGSTHGGGRVRFPAAPILRRHFTPVMRLHKAAGEPFWGCRPQRNLQRLRITGRRSLGHAWMFRQGDHRRLAQSCRGGCCPSTGSGLWPHAPPRSPLNLLNLEGL